MPFNLFPFRASRGSLGVFPHLENFISEGNSLGMVVADLLPLLRQSIDWFRDLVREAMSEVRSSELETGLSSSGEPVEGDTAVSAPREVRAFYALNEECGLDNDTLSRFKDRFQFPKRVRVRLPSKGERACNFFSGGGVFLRILLFLWVEIPRPPIPYGAARLFWYRSWAAHAQFVENSGQLYGDMASCYGRGYAQD